MTLGFDIQYSDMLAFTRHYVSTDKSLQRGKWVSLLLFPVVLFLFVLFSTDGSGKIAALISTVFILVLYVVFILILYRRLPVRMAKKITSDSENAGVLGYRDMTFTDDAIFITGSKFESKISWDAITKVGYTNTHFLLYISANQAYIIPKRAITAAQVEELAQLLNNKIKK